MDNSIVNKIKLMQGDITKLHVDVIVNAANKTLLGGGGVDGAIHRAAGPQLIEECKTLNGCQTGEAKITKGYNLPADYIIHTVGPIYSGKPHDSRLLANCYKNSFALANEHHVASIAFPAISCGVYGYPIKEACRIALDTTVSCLETYHLIQKVYFALFSSSDLNVYQRYFESINSNIPQSG